jgi:hypothetical protein
MTLIGSFDQAAEFASKGHAPDLGSMVLPVVGAGHLALGTYPVRSGDAQGLYLGVSWGNNGYAGGVLDVDEARQLIRFLEKFIEQNPRL